ncbi:MAG: hypothetical protein IT406_00160 [Candidatus Yanofskybacteria bacterium]|nr:hypothetical protein [Candidatus Yanofskybacteria bacterium]
MNPVIVAIVAVIIVGFGIYIGVSGIATQYAFEFSGGRAEQVACAAAMPSGTVGQPMLFSTSGIPSGTIYHWALDEGTSHVLPDGRLTAIFSGQGQKTAWLFFLDSRVWRQTACSTIIR